MKAEILWLQGAVVNICALHAKALRFKETQTLPQEVRSPSTPCARSMFVTCASPKCTEMEGLCQERHLVQNLCQVKYMDPATVPTTCTMREQRKVLSDESIDPPLTLFLDRKNTIVFQKESSLLYYKNKAYFLKSVLTS